MREKKRITVLAVAALLVAVTAGTQPDPEKVEIQVTHVGGSVYMLTGAGGNIGASVGEDGTLIVDDQFAPLAGKILAALQGVGGGDVAFVLNTHWHPDHTGGNEVFGETAPILAHTNTRRRLASGAEVLGRSVPPAPEVALPVITFDDALTVHFNGEEIRAVHFPRGHTDGDSVVFFIGSNVVHMGDDFFAGRFPFVDLDSGGDVEGLIANVRRIVHELPAGTKVIPGHGPLSTREDLEEYLHMLEATVEVVRRRMEEGKSLEAIQGEGLPEVWAAWGSGFVSSERWIATIHRSLSE